MDKTDDLSAIGRALADPKELSDYVKLEAIIRAYDRAMADPKTVIPTYLHAAIEMARRK